MATTIKEMRATDLIGRLIMNRHGAEFVCVDLTLDAVTGTVIVWVDELDLDNGGRIHAPCGLQSLNGWTVSTAIPELL